MESSFRICKLSLLASVSHEYMKMNNMRIFVQHELEYIINHLETDTRNNHYLFNIVGILLAIEMYEDLIHLLPPKLFPLDELQKILRNQFLPDGGNFEASTGYHFFVIESLAMLSICCSDARNIIEKEAYWIDGAVALMRLVLDKNGDILQIGDDDSSSCFFPIQTSRLREFQYYFCCKAFSVKESRNMPDEILYPYFRIASIKRDKVRVFLYSTRNGQNGKGGHAHNDKAAIALWFDEHPILIDSGTYSYVGKRNYFRKSYSHNVISVSGIEPCPLNYGYFCLPDFSQADLEIYEPNHWIATFKLGAEDLLCRRELTIEDKMICGFDKIDARLYKQKKASLFVVGTDVEVSLTEGDKIAKISFFDKEIQLIAPVPLKLIQQYVSPRYGFIAKTNKICLTWPDDVTEVTWWIRW